MERRSRRRDRDRRGRGAARGARRRGEGGEGGEERGRAARTPTEIPAPGWRDILLRVKREANDDQVDLVAAGVAYYALLALPPALAALVSLYALAADPATIESQVASVPALPQEARDIVGGQLRRVGSGSSSALGIGLAVSLALALWSASKAAKALMGALNIVYDETESRGFFRLNLVALLFTLGGILVAVFALAVLAGVPALLALLNLGPVVGVVVAVLPWLLLAGVVLGMLAVLFRYAPDRARPSWRWVTPGCALATALWLGASVLFSLYVANFGSYNETYGSLAGVVVLLLWLWLSAYLVLLGAELDAEMEHQTRHDTTVGRARPMGERGAYVADHVGETP